MPVGRFQVRLNQVYGREEVQRSRIAANVSIMQDGKEIGRLDPAMNFYPTSETPIPTPAVRSRPWGDIYVNLMAFKPDGSSATLKVIVEPLVPWIWFGGGIVCLGAIISMSTMPGRRRAPVWSAASVAPEGRTTPPLPVGATGLLATTSLEGAD